MNNFQQDGEIVTLTTPDGGVVGGNVYQVGQIVAVAVKTVTDAEYHAGATTFAGKRRGVFSVPKVGSQAWAVGALVYWDDTNAEFTTTAAGNHLAGYAMEAVGSGASEEIGVVLLDGCAREDEGT